MLNEKNLKVCREIIKSAITYCNDNLETFKGHRLEIAYNVFKDTTIREIPFIAQSRLFNDEYSIHIDSKLFEISFQVLNTLLHEKNKTFYTVVSGEMQYDLEKANIYLDLLHEISTKMIIFHELGHIFNGHLLYKINSNKANESHMFMNSELNDLSPIVSQVLEMDADCFAATRLIGQMTFESSIEHYNSVIPGIIKNKIHALILSIIGSNLVFSIQGLGRKREIKDLMLLKYLPLRARQDYFVRSALYSFESLNPREELVLGDKILDINFFREVLPNLEQYTNLFFQEVYGFSPETFNSKNNLNEIEDDVLKHCDLLDGFWSSEMRNKLLPYSYFILAY